MFAILLLQSLLSVPTPSRPPAVDGIVPHLAGQLSLNPPAGEIDGSLCLTRFTPRRTARFLLGNPLNIKVVTDSAGNPFPYDGEYGGRIIGEAREYIVRQRDSLPPLTALCVRFRGAVPPFDSGTAFTDWKGRIASMRGNLRAAEQTRWYPTLFDSATSATEDRVTYDLSIRCATCNAIYVNGAQPVSGTMGQFVSAVPRTLMLYAGNFSIQHTPSVSFINGRASPPTATLFADAIARIGQMYAASLSVPYGEHPVLLSFESVSRAYPNGRVGWQFVTWPTITFSGGLNFDQLIDTSSATPRLPDWLWHSISHEMGHYYFGTVRMPHGPLYWFVLESTAEYLALKSTAKFVGETVLASRLVGYLNAIVTEQTPPLTVVTNRDQVTGIFRYQFAPLQLMALDWDVGEERVARMLNALLRSDATESADIEALRRAARTAGIEPDQLIAALSRPAATLRQMVLARAQQTLASQSAGSNSPAVVQLATDLVNADSSSTGRQQILGVLQAMRARDRTNLLVLYQIGKLGAISGIELEAAGDAPEEYLRHQPPSGAPAHADADFRLGMIKERQGDRTGASAAYRRALALNPSHAGASQALAQLEKPKP